MATKKKATKKTAKRTGKALANQGRFNGGLLANTMQAPAVPTYPEALDAFTVAFEKAKNAAVSLLMTEDDEVKAHRAQVLSNLTAEASMAAHALNAAAYAKAEQG